MRMTFRPSQPANKGYALIMVMIFLGVTLLVLGSLMSWTNSNARQVKRNNLYYTSQYAAEAAVEQVIANMNRDYLHQSLNSASSYDTIIPSQTNWPVQYAFSSLAGANKTYVNIGATSTNLQPLGSQWSGLQGYSANCQVTSTATPQNQLYTVPATVTENLQYADIPLFQFAIFYNMNLEIQPGGAMTIGGPVFCNASIWAASLNLIFSNSVTADGNVSSNNISDPFMTAGSKAGSGNPTFMSTVGTNHAQLNLPIGTSNNPAAVEAILQMPPSGNSSSVYLYNQANLIISNSSSGGNVQVFYQNTNNSTALTLVPKDDTNTSSYSFVTSTNFQDYREKKTVHAIYLDVAKLGLWVTNTSTLGGATINNQTIADTGKGINSIYIYDSVPLSSSTLPGVQVGNGKQLPQYGLAIATPDPIYVEGNFNVQDNTGNNIGQNATSHTRPAALYGDALTVLSANWNDTNESSTESLRIPVPTTVNAATLEGIVPSSGTIYSGGVENFLRLLEAWSGAIPLTYNGSIVVMFPSQYATNSWGNSHYYDIPKRQWAFDLNFTHQDGLPPMTPQVKGIIRQGWARQ